MKLRLLLPALFIIFSVLPLVVTGLVVYQQVQERSISMALDHLESLAHVQEQRLVAAAENYLEKVQLVTSRTQMRVQLQAYNATQDEEAKSAVQRILKDANDSIDDIRSMGIYDPSGTLVTAVGAFDGGQQLEANEILKFSRSTALHAVEKDSSREVRVVVAGPMVLEGEVVGVLVAHLSSQPILNVTEAAVGLGDTGEVMLVQSNARGDAVFLAPLRFDSDAALSRIVPYEAQSSSAQRALSNQEGVYWDGETRDYRGERVYAAVRYIDGLDWGMVVKMDYDEIHRTTRQIARFAVIVVIISLVVVLVAARLVARAVSQPLQRIVEHVDNLKLGSFSQRIHVRFPKEVRQLAEATNILAEALEASYGKLERLVAERTKALQEKNALDEAVLSNIGEALVVVDLEGKVILINDAGRRLLPDVQVGMHWQKSVRLLHGNRVLTEQELPTIRALEQRTHVMVPMSSDYVLEVHGRSTPVAIVATPVWQDVECTGAIVLLRDVSREKEIDQAKSEFVSLASHQLRTPLSSINWYSEMLLDEDAGSLSEEQRNFIQEIRRGNQRMVELVNALLNVSRIDLGTFAVDPEPTRLDAIADEVVHELEPVISKKDMHIVREYDSTLSAMQLDPKLMRIVFQNLLTNAVKYTPESGSITIRLYQHKQNQVTMIEVADTGMGIPEAQKGKIFTKLFRADNVREVDADGTGLGLYIVKSIIDQTGGTIDFDSTEGKGTTFRIALPSAGMQVKEGSKPLEPAPLPKPGTNAKS